MALVRQSSGASVCFTVSGGCSETADSSFIRVPKAEHPFSSVAKLAKLESAQQPQQQQQQIQQGSSCSLAKQEPQQSLNQQPPKQELLQLTARIHEESTAGSSLTHHKHGRSEPARDIRKLYDDLVYQNRPPNAGDPPDPNPVHGDGRFDESKAEQILAIQTEIDESQKLAPEQLKMRKRKRLNACSNEVLLAALKRWQPTRAEWSQLAKHLRNIRSGVHRMSDLHRKMELIKSQGLAESSSSSRPPITRHSESTRTPTTIWSTATNNVELINSNLPSSMEVEKVVDDLIVNRLRPSIFLLGLPSIILILILGYSLQRNKNYYDVRAQFPPISHLMNLAIMDGLIAPALAGHYKLPPLQRALLSNGMNYVHGNSHALIFLDGIANTCSLIEASPMTGLLSGVIIYNFADKFKAAFLAAIAINQIKENDNEILKTKELLEVCRMMPSLAAVNSVLAISNFLNLLPPTVPSMQQDISSVLWRVSNMHHFDQCDTCAFIMQVDQTGSPAMPASNPPNPQLKQLFFHKHLSDFFQYHGYAFHDFPVSLLPLLRDGTVIQSLMPPHVAKRIYRTTNGTANLVVLYHGERFASEKNDWFNAIEVAETDASLPPSSSDGVVAISEIVQLFATRPRVRPYEVMLAYSGSIGGFFDFARAATAVGLIGLGTYFYFMDLQSDSDPRNNIYSLDVSLPFRLDGKLGRLWLRHRITSTLADPLVTKRPAGWEDSLVARTFRALGIGPTARLQLVIEVQPLSLRAEFPLLFGGEILWPASGNLRLRNTGVLTAKCLETVAVNCQADRLRCLNVSFCDLSALEQDIKRILQQWVTSPTGPILELNFDYAKLSHDSTVELLFALCTQPSSTLRWLSLNGNSMLGNSLFGRIKHFPFQMDPSALLRNFTSLRRLSVNDCLSEEQADRICTLATTNQASSSFASATQTCRSAASAITAVKYAAGHFKNCGILVHDFAVDSVFTGQNKLLIEL